VTSEGQLYGLQPTARLFGASVEALPALRAILLLHR
jgi:hypothetical protein